MEMLNYSTGFLYPQSYSKKRKAFYSFKSSSAFPVRLNSANVKGYTAALFKKFRLDFFSFSENSFNFLKIFTVKYLCKYYYLPLCIFASVFIPLSIDSYIQKKAETARPVNFAAPDMKNIDSIMSEFAFSESSYYDNDGNVFSSDGNLFLNKSPVKESVTYQNYTVKSGESISSISRKFGLSNISTLIAVNKIENVRALKAGQKIKIPSSDGLIHTVKAGENLSFISSKYSVAIEDLLDTNELDSEVLKSGQTLFIPGAKLDSVTLQKAMGELFKKPIHASYRLTSRFGLRADPFTGVSSRHSGIDMACPEGTAIYSTLSGKVTFTGYSNIYGNYVIINHTDGYQTLYGHMSKITCKKGQSVTQESKIGLVGNTGYSTGNHLHFSVYKNGKLIDPLTLIK